MISTQTIKESHKLSWSEAKVVYRGVYLNQIQQCKKEERPVSTFVARNLPCHSSKRRKEVRNAINLELRPAAI